MSQPGRRGIGCWVTAVVLFVLGVVMCVAVNSMFGPIPTPSTTKRTDLSPTTGRITEYPKGNVYNEDWKQWMKSKDPKQRETVFNQEAWSVPNVTHGEVAVGYLRRGLADPDPSVRLAAAEQAAKLFQTANAKHLLGFSVDEAKVKCIELMGDPMVRVRAASILWTRFEAADAGRVLAEVVTDRKASLQDRIAAARVKSNREIPRRAEQVIAALEQVFADRTDEGAVRSAAGQVLNEAAEPPESLRAIARQILDDQKEPGEVRAQALGMVTRTAADAGSQKFLADLARSPDTSVPLRVRAFGLLAPRSDTFAKEYPELAKLLQDAVADSNQNAGFRQFAAHFFTPDTAEKFATVVGLLSNISAPTTTLRRVLAQRVAASFPDNVLPPKEWFTLALVRQMAVTPSSYRTPQVEPGYTDTGEPWQVWKESALPVSNVDALFIHYLTLFWEDALPELLYDISEWEKYWLLHERRLKVLARVKIDHAAALQKALLQLLGDTKISEAKRKEAADHVFGGSWPQNVNTSWRSRLDAADATHAERLIIIKWSAGQRSDDTALDWYLTLLKEQKGAARSAVAEVIGARGPNAKFAIPELIAALKAEHTTAATTSYTAALAAIGPDSVQALGELMKEKEPKLRIAAAEALGLIGPEGRSKATPILRSAIEQEKDEAVKKAALEALGQVNPVEAKKLGWTAK